MSFMLTRYADAVRFTVVACALVVGTDAAAQNAMNVKLQSNPAATPTRRADEPVTFSKHVAPILQQKCQVCHQPNSIAPMSLLTYNDAKDVANEIRANVTNRVMPPWHLDKTVGIHDFKNDRSLSDEQIATLVRWIDGGMPEGKKEDMPPPMQFADPTAWQLSKDLGEPDLVLKSPAFTMPARTQDKWFRPVTETGITEPRWVRAIEIRPASPVGRKVVHHVLTMLEQHEEDGITGLASSAHDAQMSAGLFMEWSIGKTERSSIRTRANSCCRARRSAGKCTCSRSGRK